MSSPFGRLETEVRFLGKTVSFYPKDVHSFRKIQRSGRVFLSKDGSSYVFETLASVQVGISRMKGKRFPLNDG